MEEDNVSAEADYITPPHRRPVSSLPPEGVLKQRRWKATPGGSHLPPPNSSSPMSSIYASLLVRKPSQSATAARSPATADQDFHVVVGVKSEDERRALGHGCGSHQGDNMPASATKTWVKVHQRRKTSSGISGDTWQLIAKGSKNEARAGMPHEKRNSYKLKEKAFPCPVEADVGAHTASSFGEAEGSNTRSWPPGQTRSQNFCRSNLRKTLTAKHGGREQDQKGAHQRSEPIYFTRTFFEANLPAVNSARQHSVSLPVTSSTPAGSAPTTSMADTARSTKAVEKHKMYHGVSSSGGKSSNTTEMFIRKSNTRAPSSAAFDRMEESTTTENKQLKTSSTETSVLAEHYARGGSTATEMEISNIPRGALTTKSESNCRQPKLSGASRRPATTVVKRTSVVAHPTKKFWNWEYLSASLSAASPSAAAPEKSMVQRALAIVTGPGENSTPPKAGTNHIAMYSTPVHSTGKLPVSTVMTKAKQKDTGPPGLTSSCHVVKNFNKPRGEDRSIEVLSRTYMARVVTGDDSKTDHSDYSSSGGSAVTGAGFESITDIESVPESELTKTTAPAIADNKRATSLMTGTITCHTQAEGGVSETFPPKIVRDDSWWKKNTTKGTAQALAIAADKKRTAEARDGEGGRGVPPKSSTRTRGRRRGSSSSSLYANSPYARVREQKLKPQEHSRGRKFFDSAASPTFSTISSREQADRDKERLAGGDGCQRRSGWGFTDISGYGTSMDDGDSRCTRQISSSRRSYRRRDSSGWGLTPTDGEAEEKGSYGRILRCSMDSYQSTGTGMSASPRSFLSSGTSSDSSSRMSMSTGYESSVAGTERIREKGNASPPMTAELPPPSPSGDFDSLGEEEDAEGEEMEEEEDEEEEEEGERKEQEDEDGEDEYEEEEEEEEAEDEEKEEEEEEEGEKGEKQKGRSLYDLGLALLTPSSVANIRWDLASTSSDGEYSPPSPAGPTPVPSPAGPKTETTSLGTLVTRKMSYTNKSPRRSVQEVHTGVVDVPQRHDGDGEVDAESTPSEHPPRLIYENQWRVRCGIRKTGSLPEYGAHGAASARRPRTVPGFCPPPGVLATPAIPWHQQHTASEGATPFFTKKSKFASAEQAVAAAGAWMPSVPYGTTSHLPIMPMIDSGIAQDHLQHHHHTYSANQKAQSRSLVGKYVAINSALSGGQQVFKAEGCTPRGPPVITPLPKVLFGRRQPILLTSENFFGPNRRTTETASRARPHPRPRHMKSVDQVSAADIPNIFAAKAGPVNIPGQESNREDHIDSGNRQESRGRPAYLMKSLRSKPLFQSSATRGFWGGGRSMSLAATPPEEKWDGHDYPGKGGVARVCSVLSIKWMWRPRSKKSDSGTRYEQDESRTTVIRVDDNSMMIDSGRGSSAEGSDEGTRIDRMKRSQSTNSCNKRRSRTFGPSSLLGFSRPAHSTIGTYSFVHHNRRGSSSRRKGHQDGASGRAGGFVVDVNTVGTNPRTSASGAVVLPGKKAADGGTNDPGGAKENAHTGNGGDVQWVNFNGVDGRGGGVIAVRQDTAMQAEGTVTSVPGRSILEDGLARQEEDEEEGRRHMEALLLRSRVHTHHNPAAGSKAMPTVGSHAPSHA